MQLHDLMAKLFDLRQVAADQAKDGPSGSGAMARALTAYEWLGDNIEAFVDSLDPELADPAPAKTAEAARKIAADLERSAGRPLGEGSWGSLAVEPVARAIAQAREAVEPEGPFIVMSSNYSRPFLLGCYETLAQAVTAQCGSPEKWDIFTRHPAPAGEAVEPLEDRIDNAVQAMSETHHSWESRCHAIMAALGFNFGWADPKCDEDPATSNNARLREDLGQAESDKAILYTKLQDAERERDDARKALETATDDRERLVEAVSTFLGKGEDRDAVSCHYCGDTHGGNRCRSGGDHDFDPTGERIWEFEGKDVDALRAALATEKSR